MPETIIESVLNGQLSAELLIKWLNDNTNKETPEECTTLCCNKSEFVAYFLSYLRNQTDKILKTNTNALQILQHQNTPEKLFNSQRKHRRSISEPKSNDQDSKPKDLLTVDCRNSKSHGSPHKEKISHKKPGRKVKTKLFLETEPLVKSRSHENSLNLSPKTDSDESRLSSGVSSLVLSSTPIKNGWKASEYPCLPLSSPVTPQESRSISRHSSYNYLPNERCDTPRMNHRNRMSNPEKSMPSLADYVANAQPCKSTKKKKNTKNVSNESPTALDSIKVDLDISSSDMFPEIGAKRQSSSLRLDKEKRRIKPTHLDSSSKRSFSLNSFNTESFQQSSVMAIEENLAFKYQVLQPKEAGKSFEAERNMLKQERHKLMEKFNILNTNSSPKIPSTPQIKVVKKDSVEKPNLITAELNKVKFKEKIDILIEIYMCLLKNNFVLNRSSEIYFLISILLSKQFEEDYLEIENKLDDDNSLSEFILRSIHNCSYFAVKCLWGERYVLELMLDKVSLKFLGENKLVRSYYPELAKFLLNLYGLKIEAELLNKEEKTEVLPENKFINGFVCFNFETDNVDNFPSMLSFQNFKKQRDLFYEILRWWSEPSKTSTCFRTSLRSRVKTLLSLAVAPDNHAHLARLVCDHIVAECFSHVQESKLSKLQRRLLGPSSTSAGAGTGHEAQRLPKFTDRELFYKDLIGVAENESFRIHVRDALTTELLRLNSTVTLADLRNASTSNNISKGYLQIIKKLCVLAKFVGYITSLPYTQLPVDYAIKSGLDPSNILLNTIPKEKILKTEIEVRNYMQPAMDLKQILIDSQMKHRLVLTIPWLVHYLAMLDYTSLRTEYYTKLLNYIFGIYQTVLKDNNNEINNELSKHEAKKRNTVIYLSLCLGWLFDMPHFPQHIYYCYNLTKVELSLESCTDKSLDFLDVINEYVLFEVCGYLKELNLVLLTSDGAVDKDINSFRHITPVTMTLNTTDRIKNKERQIQARLEEELIKSQPSSTRRVLDMVIDRISSATIKELNTVVAQSRDHAKADAVRVVLLYGSEQPTSLLTHLQTVYQSELRTLQSKLVEVARTSLRSRASGALVALLANNVVKAPLESVAVKAGLSRVGKWIDDNCSDGSILCKDIEAEMKNLLVLGENSLPITPKVSDITVGDMDTVHVSPSSTIINLKEHICLLLEYEPCDHESILSVLDATRQSCSTDNMFSRPTTSAAILQLTCELCIVYISRCPVLFSDTFLQKINAIWNLNCPDRRKHIRSESPPSRNFDDTDDRCVTPVSDEDLDNSNKKLMNNIKISNSPKIVTQTRTVQAEPEVVDQMCVSRILCARNIMLLSTTRMEAGAVWDKMADFLVFLLKYDYLGEDSLTEQCLAVYRQDWPQNVLENLSRCMRSVSTQWGTNSGGKFNLFLDFLAEYCNDIDYEHD